MKVAVVQFASGTDKAANLVRVRELVARAAAAGAELVIAPEAAMHPFGAPGDPLAALAEPLDGPFVNGLAASAAEHGVTAVAGMFESVPGDSAKAFNTVVAVNGDGLIGRYRKLHLFDALGWRESESLAPGVFDGSELLVFDCGEFTVGVLTCYDIRFPEIARALIDRGVTLLALPSAWVAGPLKEEQWSTLVRARAIESTVYLVAADQCPPTYAGRSMIVDPVGVPLAQLADQVSIAVANVTAERVAEVQERMPSLRHRRYRVEPG
ncbi:MAG: carbon-nitrogen hydrolase family protein [Frankiaceae bacterium]